MKTFALRDFAGRLGLGLACCLAFSTSAQPVTPFTFTRVAGAPYLRGTNDGPALGARLDVPYFLTVDAAGNVFLTCPGDDTIRKITPAGTVITIAGQHGRAGTADGNAGAARLNTSAGIAVGPQGNLFISCVGSGVIVKCSPAPTFHRVLHTFGQSCPVRIH